MIEGSAPLPYESIGAAYGYVLYSISRELGNLSESFGGVAGEKHVNISIDRIHDRAHIFIDRRRVGILERGPGGRNWVAVESECIAAWKRLDILVENLGRVNFGPHLADRKGILGAVSMGSETLIGKWEMRPLSLQALSALPSVPTHPHPPHSRTHYPHSPTKSTLKSPFRHTSEQGVGRKEIRARGEVWREAGVSGARGVGEGGERERESAAEPQFVRGAFDIGVEGVADTFLSTRFSRPLSPSY